MKNMMCVLTLLVLLAVIGAISMPTLAESWQTRYGTGVLTPSSTGRCVMNFESDLQRLGYDVIVDGIYDGDTVNEVMRFQRANGLTVTGTADTSTKIALWNRTY